MKILLRCKQLSIVTVLLLASCAAPIKQFYPDTYYEEDHIYENKPLGFNLKFDDNWIVITDPNMMSPGLKSLAKSYYKAGAELLFVGSTLEGFLAVRGLAVNLNEPTPDYAARIRDLNKKDISNDQGLTEIIEGRNSMIKWVYDKSGFRFVDFIFTINTYDIRISFWCLPENFDKFLPVFERIMSTLQVT